MRIVYCIERITGTGGLQRILIDKMNYLAEHTAHEIILMTVWHTDRPLAFPLSEKVRRIHLNVPCNFALLPLALMRFNKQMERLKPDNCIVFRAVGAFLAAFTVWKGRMIFESHTPLEHMHHQWLYPLMMKKIDTVICLTQGDARNFTKAKRTIVIPNYCALDTKNATPDYNNKHVVSIGRDSDEKDFPRMRRIWDEVKKLHPDWVLDIHHNTKDVVAAYTSGSIYLMTSQFEGFPLTLLEAQSCGLPVIAFDCPHGPRDIIHDGKDGFLIPYGKDIAPEESDRLFIEKLSYLIDHPEQRQRMGQAAQQSAAQFRKAEIMNRWLKELTN